MTPQNALLSAQAHAANYKHYVVINADGARLLVEWECQECGERGTSEKAALVDTTPVTGFHILHLTPTDSDMFKASCHCGRWSPTVLVTRQEARDVHDLHLLKVSGL
jgi:hypothetical protein